MSKPPFKSEVRWLRLSQMRRQPAQLLSDAPVVAVLPWVNEAAARQAADLMVARAGAPLQVLAVQDDEQTGPVVIWNLGLAYTRSPYLIYCAEDGFAGRYWLRFGLQAMSKGAGLLAFNDGKWFGQLAGFGMVYRPWIQRIYGGTLFHPAYRQHYGDTELTLIARQQDKLAYHPHALLVEVDYGKDQKTVNPQDQEFFRLRMRSSFDGRVTDTCLLSSFG